MVDGGSEDTPTAIHTERALLQDDAMCPLPRSTFTHGAQNSHGLIKMPLATTALSLCIRASCAPGVGWKRRWCTSQSPYHSGTLVRALSQCRRGRFDLPQARTPK